MATKKPARKRLKKTETVSLENRDRLVGPTDFSEPMGEPDADEAMINEGAPITENDDGSATVMLGEADEQRESKFNENLAEFIEDTVLGQIATRLLLDIERDKESRSKRDEQYAEGIKRTGMGGDAPGGAQFSGASRAVHPVLIEGCVDFAARAMKELFPPTGPVKQKIIGEATKEKIQRAERKEQYMNWQCTKQIREYRRELEVLLTQLPLGGGQYLKVYQDIDEERPRTEFVPIDDLLLPFEAASLLTAQRVTHVQRITKETLDARVANGFYRDVAIGDPVLTPDQTKSGEAAARVEGNENVGWNEDGLRTVFETQLRLELDDPLTGKYSKRPYIITVDEASQKVLALRRNWDEKDDNKNQALDWIVEYPMIPWRGAYPIGLAHLIGSLTGAATGALRALLDSALVNTMPGGIKLKGARVTGQSISIEPTQLSEIDAGPGVDDIRKLAMPFPFNPPSTVLFQLLEWITNQAKGVVATAEERIADATNTMPVGTALALIEQGSITFSAIHGRLHAAQAQTLAIIHRLDAQHLSDHEVVEDLGELVVSRQDFQGPMDIEPVSDPNIFSDAQRYAQLQAAMQLSAMAPQLYKQNELHKRALRLLKMPAPDEVLNVPKDPEELDGVHENTAAADPLKTIKAYPDQDHMQHLMVHVAFMSSPVFAANPMMATPTLNVLLAHCKEHMLMLYEQEVSAAVAAQEMLAKARGQKGNIMDAISIAEQQLMQQVGPLVPHLQQAQQLAQQLAPKLPEDPAMVKAHLDFQAKQMTNQVDQQKVQLDQQRLQMEQQQNQVNQQMTQMMAMLEKQRDDQDRMLEQWQTKLEMATSQRNADMAMAEAQAERQSRSLIAAGAEQAETHRNQISSSIQLALGLLQQMNDAQAATKKTAEGVEVDAKRKSAEHEDVKTAFTTLLSGLQELLVEKRQRPKRFRFSPDGQTIEPEFE